MTFFKQLLVIELARRHRFSEEIFQELSKHYMRKNLALVMMRIQRKMKATAGQTLVKHATLLMMNGGSK